eukprot:s3597_g4.t1
MFRLMGNPNSAHYSPDVAKALKDAACKDGKDDKKDGEGRKGRRGGAGQKSNRKSKSNKKGKGKGKGKGPGKKTTGNEMMTKKTVMSLAAQLTMAWKKTRMMTRTQVSFLDVTLHMARLHQLFPADDEDFAEANESDALDGDEEEEDSI